MLSLLSPSFSFSRTGRVITCFILLLGGVTGCLRPSKTDQCTQLIEISNRGSQLIYTSLKKTSKMSSQQLKKGLEKTAYEIDLISLPDETLVSFKDPLSQNFRDLAQSFQDLNNLLVTMNKIPANFRGQSQFKEMKLKANDLGKKINLLGQEHDTTMQKVNDYCQRNLVKK